MFPQIRRNRKKGKIGSYEMQKQCQQAMRQLELVHGKCLQSLPLQVISDYKRVCKLKDIPRFYSQYFTYFVAQGSKQSMQLHFDEQTDNIMLGRSYYDKISTLIKQRGALVIELQSQIDNTKLTSSLSIIQLRKIVALITGLRENLKQMIESVISWQFWLRNIGGGDKQADHDKQLAIVFPENGINCIFIGLYDLQLLRTSFLSEQISFSSSNGYDPFLIEIQLLTNTSKMFKDVFYIPLLQGIQGYKKVQQYLISCIPLDKNTQHKDQLNREPYSQRVILNRQRPVSSKQIKIANNNTYKSLKITDEKLGTKVKLDQRQVSTKSTNQLQHSIGQNHRQKSRTMSNALSNSAKRVQNVYKLSNNNTNKLSNTNINKPSNTNALKLNHNKNSSLLKVIVSKPQSSNTVDKMQLQRIVREKELLMKELRTQKIQREQLSRIVKQVDSRTSYQHRMFEQKTERYQNQIHTLKTTIKQKQVKNSISNNHNISHNQNTSHNQNKLVSKVYQHNTNNRKSQSPLLLMSNQKREYQQKRARNKLLQKVSENRLLQERISQLMMEKANLQRLVEKEGNKADKQRDLYQRKIQNYHQTIQRLKYQANQALIVKEVRNNHSVNDVMARRQQRYQSVTKIYATNCKNSIKTPSPQLRRAPLQHSLSIGASYINNGDNQQRKERGLMITNRDDIIEIVYSPTQRNKKNSQLKQQQMISRSQGKQFNEKSQKISFKQHEQNIKQYSRPRDILTHHTLHIYQQFITENQLKNYISRILLLSSADILQLNNNSLLFQLVQQAQTLVILIAKDPQKQIQIGICILHKQHQRSQYICDYILVHDMSYFLSIVVNFTLFIFENDLLSSSVVFDFKKDSLKQQESIKYFAQFEEQCKRFGQVFVYSHQGRSLKYVLKKELFYDNVQDQTRYQDNRRQKQRKGMVLQTKLQVIQRLIKQKQKNKHHKQLPSDSIVSQTFLLSMYMQKNPQLLKTLKPHININNRQLLTLSTILSEKKFFFKELTQKLVGTGEKVELYNKLGKWFEVDDLQKLKIQELRVYIEQSFQARIKRCAIGTDSQSVQYCMFMFNQQLKKCQSSNYKQTGILLPITPKYDLLIIPASQFLTLSQSDSHTSIFSYSRNFIKSTTTTKRHSISRVFLPEIKFTNWRVYKQLSQQLGKTIIGQEQLKIGYEGQISNSVIYSPRKNDLVIEKPFIVCVLSAVVENIVVEGCPMFCTIVS